MFDHLKVNRYTNTLLRIVVIMYVCDCDHHLHYVRTNNKTTIELARHRRLYRRRRRRRRLYYT